MSDHDMRIGESGARTSDTSTRSDNDPSLARGVPVAGAGDTEDQMLGSPKGGGNSADVADTGPGRYGGEQDLQPGGPDPHSTGTMPGGGEQRGSDRTYVTDASDAPTAGQAREAAHEMGGRWGSREGGEVH
jgi:hypothetical protein